MAGLENWWLSVEMVEIIVECSAIIVVSHFSIFLALLAVLGPYNVIP